MAAHVIRDWKGLVSAPVNVPVVGSRLVMAVARVSPADSTSPINVTFPNMRSIAGFIVQVYLSGGNLAGVGEGLATTGIDVTIDGTILNRLVLADGASEYTLESGHEIYIMVWGPSKL